MMDQVFSIQDKTARGVEWRHSADPVAYPDALDWMESRVALIRSGEADECVWLLEHPPLYTAGTSADERDLLSPGRFPVYRSGRGGQYTYHGPGQRIAYVMLDLARRGKDIRAFVCALEDCIMDALEQFGIKGERRAGRVGVWIVRTDLSPQREDKIAAVGVRVRRWVTYHGVSLNVAPELSHYDGIVPCGVREHGVTSLSDFGVAASMQDVDEALKRAFGRRF